MHPLFTQKRVFWNRIEIASRFSRHTGTAFAFHALRFKDFFPVYTRSILFSVSVSVSDVETKKKLIDKTNGPLLPFPIDNFGWHYIVQRSKRNNLFRGDLYARSFQLTFLMISHCDKQIMLINLR